MLDLSLSNFADKINEIVPTFLKEFSRMQIDELYKGKITLPQFLILDFLDRNGPSNMKNLAQLMRVTTAATTGIVDRLVKSGYVKRGYDSSDRRVIKINLTDKGESLVRNVNQRRRQMVIKIFSKLPESDRRDYLRIITQMKNILTKERSHIK